MESAMKPTFFLFTLALGLLAAHAAMAQSDLGLKSIGGAVGIVSPENLSSTFSLGAVADWGTVAPRIGLESHLDYWSQSSNTFGYGSSFRDVTLGARAKYYFEVRGSKLRPFAGGGLGIHFLHSDVTVPAFPGLPGLTASGSDTKIGLDLGGGFAMPVGPRTDFLGEAWYGIVSDVSQLALRVGLTYRLVP
jgi:opacity protein-like surface antigen